VDFELVVEFYESCRYGYLTPRQSQLIHTEVATLCGELRPEALNLVDSFGLPQSFLGPIASDWVEYNSWKNVLYKLKLQVYLAYQLEST
jgi:acyl-CoA oxidase